MLINLGVGLPASGPAAEGGEGEEEGDMAEAGEGMDVDGGAAENGAGEGGVDGEEGGEEGEAGDYGALALVDTVIEEREQRLSDEDVTAILSIIRETLGSATT
jgi:hypothetical protein